MRKEGKERDILEVRRRDRGPESDYAEMNTIKMKY